MDPLLQLCKQFLRIDSRNSHGTAELADFVAAQLSRRGFAITRQRAHLLDRKQVNLIARIGPKPTSKKRPLLLNTHLDTVETDPKAWTQTGGDPFRPVLRKGRLYGLGAADTKLALACQLQALDALPLERLKRPIMMTATYGEEMGLLGVQKLIRGARFRPAFMLNSEPSALQPCHGNFGFRIYRLAAFQLKPTRVSGYRHRFEFAGKAAHSAVPQLGRSAVLQCLEWLRRQDARVMLHKVAGGIAPNIVPASCEIAVISTQAALKGWRTCGAKLNGCETVSDVAVYPDLAAVFRRLPSSLLGMTQAKETSNLGRVHFGSGYFELTVSHRFAPGHDPDRRYQRWQRDLKGLRRQGVHVALRLEKANPAFRQPAGRPFVRTVQGILQRMHKPSQLLLRPGCNESLYLAQLGGDVLTIGPGEAYGNIHAPNESVRLNELRDAVTFYKKVFERLCF